MFKARLKHKVSGEVIDCRFYYDNTTPIYYNPLNESEKYNINEYDNIPLYPYELFGVECDVGWKSLYLPVLNYIDEYNKNKEDDEKINVTQIKEKYGHLEIYTNYTTTELSRIINEVHEESDKVCEHCGSREDVGMVIGGWLYVSCLECLLKKVKDNGRCVCWHRNSDNKRYWIHPNGELEECKEELP